VKLLAGVLPCHRSSAGRRPGRVRLGIEVMEERCTPSGLNPQPLPPRDPQGLEGPIGPPVALGVGNEMIIIVGG
jgi:hypothetical protein